MAEKLAVLRSLPPSTMIAVRDVVELIDSIPDQPVHMPTCDPEAVQLPWSALLWLVPGETRIGIRELCEAVGRPRSWVHRHTAERGNCQRLPHRLMDGRLIFVAEELRQWLLQHEILA